MERSGRERWYWRCQVGGWGTYSLLNLLLASASGKLAEAAGPMVLLSVAGLLETHLLRARVKRRGWAQLPFARLVPRVLGASVLLGLGLTAFGLFQSLLLWRVMTPAQIVPGAAVYYLVTWSIVFLAWQLIYFTVQFFERWRQAEAARWQLTAAARTAELRFLQSQVNPHFLFNALNGVRALIVEDPARAQQAVTQLARLLRHSLASGEARTATLADELERVRDYLALEGLRLEERLRVRIEIAPDCLALPVPVLLLQTLVENGIKHGIARLPAGGEIAVEGRRDGEALSLRVTNTTATDGGRVEGPGVGLANARERLRLLFGAGASLGLEHPSPSLTAAQVRIPVARA